MLTLLGISRRLRRMQPDADARAAYREVECDLRRMVNRMPRPASGQT